MNGTNANTQLITGRKVFFINPNLTVFPENFCEDYMSMGFECYFVMKDSLVSLEEKIDILVKGFKDVVIFFFIDSPEPKPKVTWLQFISSLNTKYKTPPLIGIIYEKRPSQRDAELLDFLYTNEAKVTCGTYMLEFNKRKNFDIMLRALANLGVLGRRKNVRVLCSANCKIRFTYELSDFFVNISDISMSHFTCIFDAKTFPVDINERVSDIEFNIKGLRFGHAATVLLKRPNADGREICVFAFTNKNDQFGLDPNIQDTLLEKLYGLLVENFNKDFDKFHEENLKWADKRPISAID